MLDFMFGFVLAFPSALLITYWLSYWIHAKENPTIAYDITTIKEDLANLQVKLSGFLSHV